jgi:hypothetical protein
MLMVLTSRNAASNVNQLARPARAEKVLIAYNPLVGYFF